MASRATQWKPLAVVCLFSDIVTGFADVSWKACGTYSCCVAVFRPRTQGAFHASTVATDFDVHCMRAQPDERCHGSEV